MHTCATEASDIDFVLLWVDGEDPAWREKKAQYIPVGRPDDTATGEQRYRDWNLLRYWFRGVEKFAPWVRKVFFITDDQWPEWLDRNAPRLVCTRHRDFIPEKYLPTFSSHTIELNLHRIDGLSERFVYFNDDTFIGRPVSPGFFFRNGLPFDLARLEPVVPHNGNGAYDHARLNNTAVINRHFRGRRRVFLHPGQWLIPWRNSLSGVFWNALLAASGPFPGFADPHLPYSFRKSTLVDVWNAEPDCMDRTCSHKFRDCSDVSAGVFRQWQIASGRFIPRTRRGTGEYYAISPRSISALCNAIRKMRHPLYCANDALPLSKEEFLSCRKQIADAFQTVLPDPSSFEKPKQ